MGCLGEAERQEQRGRHDGVRQPGGAAEGEVWNLKSCDGRGPDSSTTPGNALQPASVSFHIRDWGWGVGGAEEPLSVLHQSSIVFQPSYQHRIRPFQYKNLSTQSVWSTLNVLMF
ncbi:hypothetical protein EPR50_G00121580 [Perca flavescens]|uniref:Uncharacterized protein n=1 Tax=Perca flavescens TaxID=8167 RepID=A0A484CWE6_PERFV|nr:hypothetical protein EPR50_G00121580 [Perca flavescens]